MHIPIHCSWLDDTLQRAVYWLFNGSEFNSVLFQLSAALFCHNSFRYQYHINICWRTDLVFVTGQSGSVQHLAEVQREVIGGIILCSKPSVRPHNLLVFFAQKRKFWKPQTMKVCVNGNLKTIKIGMEKWGSYRMFWRLFCCADILNP